MCRPDELERRITELEVKISFADDLVDRLNAVVARQQEQIEFLVREVVRLRDQSAQGPTAAITSLRDEMPPHY